MTKREKVIVSIVAVVSIAAGYVQFFGSSGREDKRPDLDAMRRELTSFVTTTSTLAAQAKPGKKELYAIARAQAPGGRDPFLSSDALFDLEREEKESAVAFPAFSYTGFVGQGKRRIAVIDGNEYEEGQELDSEGFFLRKIFPEKVIIGVKSKEQETEVMLIGEKLP